MAAAGRAIILPKQGNCLWPVHVRILSEYKRSSCLKPASDSLRRPNCANKHTSLPLLQCWPKSCTGSPARKSRASNKMGVALGHRSVIRQCGCRTRGRLSAPRWENGRRSCLRSVMPPETHFQKMAGISSFARGNPSVVGDLRGIRRQTTMSTSIKALVGRCRTLPPRSGNGLFAIATSIDPQYRHFATGPYPPDVFDGLSRKRDEAVSAQSARHDPAPARPLSRAEGDLGIDPQRDLIGALPRTRFSSTANASCVKADGCLLTLKRGVNT